MLKNLADYDASLEAFSRPLLQLIDYRLDENLQMTVNNETVRWYQFMELTVQAEALLEFVIQTFEEELVEELQFLANYDRTKKAIQEIVDIPDRLIDLFIKLCLQNNWKLSDRKRGSFFRLLEDKEISAMEQVVRNEFFRTE